MPHITIRRLAQDREVPVRTEQVASLRWRYTYGRASDSRSTAELGQDYLTFRRIGGRFLFALCDGVGQSFFGDLASRLLGDALVEWLWRSSPNSVDPREIQQSLVAALTCLTERATRQVQAHPLPLNLPSMVEDILNEKRALGSESTFVCGRVDLPRRRLPGGRLTLAWMGDSRLRLWSPGGERTRELGDTFHTVQRWSSLSGPVRGQPHVFVGPLRTPEGEILVTRLVAYSDGLSILDGTSACLSDAELECAVQASLRGPTSDDISFLEIWPGTARRQTHCDSCDRCV